jgi:hypothetical protein
MSAEWGTNTITERWLVKMDSPLQTVADVQEQLPAYGATAEPTFTIGISYHPRYVNLKLKSLNSLTPHPEGQPFWIVDVTYETGQWLINQLGNGPQEDQGRGNLGPKKKFDEDGVPIKLPWQEPPTWSGNTRTVRGTTFHDADGNLLRHANGMPVTEGMQYEIVLEVHQFTWNIEYETFNYANMVRPYINKVNEDTCYGRPEGYVLLETLTATENFRTQTVSFPDGETPPQEVDYHFVTLNATFVIDRRPVFAGRFSWFREQYRRVSMNTQQSVLGAFAIFGYAPIPVNARGDFAETPWPLLSADAAAARGKIFGSAVPYDEMGDIDPIQDFHYIDALYPETANLDNFVNNHKLVIP